MGCLFKLIFLPVWWTCRLAWIALRGILAHTTPVRFLGYPFGIGVAIAAPAALLGALVCRYGAAWYRTHARRRLRRSLVLALDAVAIVLIVAGVLLWRRAAAPPYWITSAWGGQLLAALVFGVLLPVFGRPHSWSYLGYLVEPLRFLATWGAGLLLGPAVYLAFTLFFRLPDLARRLRDQGLVELRWRRAVQPGYQSLRLRRTLRRGRGHPLGVVRWGLGSGERPALRYRAGEPGPPSHPSRRHRLREDHRHRPSRRRAPAAGLGDAVPGLQGRPTAADGGPAEARGTTCRLVDPDLPDDSLQYNPCTGSPADISNKLVGALAFSDRGEVYKQVSQLALGLIATALQALGRRVTLDELIAGLSPEAVRDLIGALARAGKSEVATELRTQMEGGRLNTETLETVRARLANFRRSHFAPILGAAPPEKCLDLDDALGGGVTYISLPVTAASEDVPLMARILLQDLKQAVARREHRLGRFARRLPTTMSMAVSGVSIGNVLVVIDEFAALQEPGQLQDLLLQARSAAVTLALSSQLMPQDPVLAAAVKGVGLFASLRVSDVDAQQVSDLFGTYDALEVTHQSGRVGGASDLTGTGSVREVQRYVAHPNDIKRLPDTVAVVKLDHVAGRGRSITAVRFWPAEADWPESAPVRARTVATAGEGEETPYADLPWLPEPPAPEPI